MDIPTSMMAPNLPMAVNPVNPESMYTPSPAVGVSIYSSGLVRPPVPPELENTVQYTKDLASAMNNGQALGQSGTLIFQGIITLEEYNPNLQGYEAMDTYDEMRRSDGAVRAALQACKLPIISTEWRVEPASQDPKDVLIQEFVADQLFTQLNWKKTLRESLLEFDYGFSVSELVYKTVVFQGKTLIGLKELASRKQRTIFSWVTQQDQRGITQIVPSGGTLSIPREKLLLVVHEQEGDNYQGISLLRAAYKHWFMKAKLENIDMIANSRIGSGVPEATPPESASDQDKKNVVDLLTNMRVNESSYVMKPNGWDIGYMDLKSNTIKETLPSIQYHENQIMLSVLVQFLNLGTNGSKGGSKALSADHSEFFIQALEAEADNLVESFQQDVVNRLVAINFGDATPPKLRYAPLGSPDVDGITKAYDLLVRNQSVHPDFEDEQYLRQLISMPLRDENEMAVDEFKQKLEDMINGMGSIAQPLPPPPPGPGQPPNQPDENDPDDTDDEYTNDFDEAQTASEKHIADFPPSATPAPIGAPNPLKSELRQYVRGIQITIAQREVSGDEITKEEVKQMEVELLQKQQEIDIANDVVQTAQVTPDTANEKIDKALHVATELLEQANDYARKAAQA
jgi:hypothetical protein